MEVEASGVAISQDASFLKDAAVESEMKNIVEPAINADNESDEATKTPQADCSTTDKLEKVIEEKDDLLAQIEEACNNKVSNLENSDEIIKSSEHEFFKKIEELEIKSIEIEKSEQTLSGDIEAKDCFGCETSNIDAVIVGDKVLLLKEDNRDCSSTVQVSTKPDDVNEFPIKAKLIVEEKSDNSVYTDVPGKDVSVSSSTSRIEKDPCFSENGGGNLPKESCSPEFKCGDENMQIDDEHEPFIEEMEVDLKDTLTDTNTVALAETEPKQAEINETLKNNDTSRDNLFNDPTSQDTKSDSYKIETKDKFLTNHSDMKEIVKTPIMDDSTNKTSRNLSSKENVVSISLPSASLSSFNISHVTLTQKPSVLSDNAGELYQIGEEDIPKTKSVSENSTTQGRTYSSGETNQPSAEKYIDPGKKYNGIADTTTDEEDNKNRSISEEFKLDKTHIPEGDVKKDNIYEVNVGYELNDIRYLTVKRLDLFKNRKERLSDKASENSVERSSNGNFTGLPDYSVHQLEETSASSSLNCHNLQNSHKKETLSGIEELCNFMINQFTCIKRSFDPDSSKAVTMAEADAILTPIPQMKKNKKNSPPFETPSTSAGKTKRVRKRSIIEDEIEENSKPKQAKRDVTKEISDDNRSENDEMKFGPCVLAKWVDKKFYAGKITAEKSGNKYVVLFEDGASKTLPKESIVFGEGDILPLQDQQIFALVDEDYESGIVLSIEKCSSKAYYIVKTETATVKVTASDIYLDVDQAKEIQKLQNLKVSECFEEGESSGTRPSRNKRPPASPSSTPEAGYSGAVAKRGGKRQKRRLEFSRLAFNSVPICLPDCTDSSDTLESSSPVSPKQTEGLELVEGVQPELQNTSNDSELFRMIFMSDYEKTHPDCDVDELLGPLPKLNTLFRNKHFLLTCTVGLRPHRFFQETDKAENSRYKQFSAVPFIKHHLQKQLEAGGAKLYSYFEDVPKSKYKQCKLIAPRPCLTAKYVQCLASDIQAVSHDWVIESCRQNKLTDISQYYLPAGWSILNETFMQWKPGKNNHVRKNAHPFVKSYVLIAGEHSDFVEFWGRVCKAAGAKLGFIKSLDDVTPTTTGYMVTESDFSHAVKSKAFNYGIPVVSTVWVVQSLIMGGICPPHTHPRLSQVFEDDEVEKWSLNSDSAS